MLKKNLGGKLLDIWTIIFVIAIIILVAGVAIYYLNNWIGKKQAMQNEMVEQHKQAMSVYVIDKKKEKIENANLPKAVVQQMPKMSKMFKVPLVKVKVGPQITTMLCDEAVFEALPLKKTVTVEVAGLYIVGMKGLKTKMEMEEMRKARRKGGNTETETPLKWHEKILQTFRR